MFQGVLVGAVLNGSQKDTEAEAHMPWLYAPQATVALLAPAVALAALALVATVQAPGTLPQRLGIDADTHFS